MKKHVVQTHPKIFERKLQIKERGPFVRRFRLGMTTHPNIERMMYDEFLRFAKHCGHHQVLTCAVNFEKMLEIRA